MGGIQFLLKTSSGRYLSSPVPAACSWKGGPGASLLSRLLPMCSLTSSVMLTETIEKVHVIELATALCFIWRQQKLVKWVPQQKPWGFSGGCSCRGGGASWQHHSHSPEATAPPGPTNLRAQRQLPKAWLMPGAAALLETFTRQCRGCQWS